ncbi:MAG TPA: 3',5'-cyclic-nucleotide phosphodiesterase [Thermoanaerobaculia bacterium]|nr:3',5'-cyclic-nucleotide phosphodiesterase [Thermoanaerobaculia bacterium]
MRVEVLGCYGGASPGCHLTCLILNDRVALDAGCLAQSLPLERQLAIEAVVVSHSHMDHTNGLPFFIDNVFGRRETLDIFGSEPTIRTLREHLFNQATWPDFAALPSHLLPTIRFEHFESERPFEAGGVRFTPIPVTHVVPTHGFLLEQDGAAMLWSSDTGPTDRLWEVANAAERLDALCIDVSFDNARQAVADASQHLTPRSLAGELAKLKRDVPVLVHHLKPGAEAAARAEIRALGDERVEFLEQGRVYEL